MKEAIGSSFVLDLIIVFTGIFIALYVGSLSYTKGFKVRNRIIDIIEQHEGYTNDAKNEITSDLKKIGYRVVDNVSCKNRNNATLISSRYNTHNYCVYEYTEKNGKYYGVTVFIHIDIPIIGKFINIPLYSETRTILEKSEVRG